MAKKYTRKQVGSLAELDHEQHRIRKMATKMENEWLDSILNPQQLALSVVTGLLSRRKQQTGGGLSLFSGKGKKKTTAAPVKTGVKQVTGSVAGFVKKPVVARIVKGVGISFLRWQAFNLAWFLGKKALKAIREKKAKQPLSVSDK